MYRRDNGVGKQGRKSGLRVLGCITTGTVLYSMLIVMNKIRVY